MGCEYMGYIPGAGPLAGMMMPSSMGCGLPGLPGGMPFSEGAHREGPTEDQFNGRGIQNKNSKSRRTIGMILIGVFAGFVALLGGRSIMASVSKKLPTA